MYTTYALVDPRNSAVRYVGFTENLSGRLAAHLTREKGNVAKEAWIQEVRNVGMEIYMRTLDTSSTLARARVREAYWIRYYLKRGANLTNVRKPPYEYPVSKKDNAVVTEYTVFVPNEGLLSKFLELEHVRSGMSKSEILYQLAADNVTLMVQDGKIKELEPKSSPVCTLMPCPPYDPRNVR